MSRLSRIISFSFCLLFLIGTLSFAQAQKTRDIPGVEQTLKEFFKGLNEGDTSYMAPIMAPDMRLTTVMERRGTYNRRSVERAGFLEAMAKPREQSWQEVIKNVRVKIDGGLAHAWMDYSFYLGDLLHHCGVNSFTLFYEKGTWVIIDVVDTQQRLNCK